MAGKKQAEATNELLTIKEIKAIIYDEEKLAQVRYLEVKDAIDKHITKAWQDEDWDTMEELQGHMENLLMEVTKSLKDQLDNMVCTLFVKYGKTNKFNMSIIDVDNNVVVCKGRIKSEDNIKALKKLGFYQRRSSL